MKTKYINILKIFILVIVCFVSVGYAAFGTEMSVSNIVADVRVKSDIRITDVSVNDGKYYSLDGFNYDVDSILFGELFWELDDYLLMDVVVTNFGNTEMGIFDIELPSGIGYEITGYKLKDKLCDSQGNCNLGASKTINLKIFPTGDAGLYTALNIDFDFRKMHTVTYEGITNNGYPTSVIDGGNLTFTASGTIPPKIIAFSNGSRVDYDTYSYTNNVFTYNNVTSDITLKYKEKAYMTVLGEDTYFKESTYKTVIDNVQFVDYVDTTNAVKTYDLSETSGTKDIIGWITSENDLYIGSEWSIYSKNLQSAFDGMINVQTISLDNLNTSETTSMRSMFSNCDSLSSIDVSLFDTSQVTDMGSMFYHCIALTELDVSGFNTKKVLYMDNMFQYSMSLTSLNVDGFDTSNVTSMFAMFGQLFYIKTLDLSSFDTSKVENMSNMFYSNYKLVSIDFSKAVFDNTVYADNMFYNINTSIEIKTKDETTKAWLESALGEGVGTVTIAS